MTTAEKYRQLEKSPAINIARYIFSCVKANATNSTLGDEIIEIKTGKTPSKQNKKFYADDYLNWFKPDEIGSDKYLYQAKDKLSKYAYENNQATIYEPDTILINAIGDVGRISILKVKASSNQQITGIRLNKKIDVDYAYFYLLANRDFFYVDLFQTTLPIVNQKKINSIPFIYPDITEQRNIIEGLVEIDKIKSVDDLKIIDKLNWNNDYKNACRNFFSVQFTSKNVSAELTHQISLVKKLRQQLLQYAIQGKLVKQNSKDESAGELLKKIKAEKEKLITEKKIKKEKELLPIKAEEIPFEIPDNWVWCRLGEITDIQRGSSPRPKGDPRYFSKRKTNFNWITISDISNYCQDSVLLETREHLTEEGSWHSRYVDVNEFIIAVSGSTTGKCCITGINGFIYDGLAVAKIINNGIMPRFLLNYMMCLYSIINDSKSGASFPNINTEYLNNLLLPLPPTKEQELIVRKIDELMKYCSDLELSIKESELQNEKLLQQVLKEALRRETVEA